MDIEILTRDPDGFTAVLTLRMQCEYRRLWDRGRERRCRQVVGLRTWRDATGTLHAACRAHWAVVEYRHPAVAA